MCLDVFVYDYDQEQSRLLSLPYLVSRQKHRSYVGYAAEPGRLSPAVSEPFGLLSARVDLQEIQH